MKTKEKITNNKIRSNHRESGKRGVNIDRSKYVIVKASIEQCLKSAGELTHNELVECVHAELKNEIKGSVSWYVERVKSDLEVQNIIVRIPGTKPAKYHLA